MLSLHTVVSQTEARVQCKEAVLEEELEEGRFVAEEGMLEFEDKVVVVVGKLLVVVVGTLLVVEEEESLGAAVEPGSSQHHHNDVTMMSPHHSRIGTLWE